MSNGEKALSSIPDQPLTKKHLKAIDQSEAVRGAISPTWQEPLDEDQEFTEDIILITEDKVMYLSREIDEGWVVERKEKYSDDDEFEVVMDDVHDYACEYSEKRIGEKVEREYNS